MVPILEFLSDVLLPLVSISVLPLYSRSTYFDSVISLYSPNQPSHLSGGNG